MHPSTQRKMDKCASKIDDLTEELYQVASRTTDKATLAKLVKSTNRIFSATDAIVKLSQSLRASGAPRTNPARRRRARR